MVKNYKGQIAVEFILLAIVITSISLAVARGLSQSGYLENLGTGPWKLLQGMIESGVWESPNNAKVMHPNYLNRQVSFRGDSD